MKKLLSLMIAVLMMISLVSCDDTLKYKGEHPELHVIATNSLLGVSGYENDKILILEEDDLGRVMFSFLGSTINSENYVLSILVAQKTTKTHSYFYDNVNFILCEVKENKSVNKDFVMQYFSNDQLETLKQKSDWNKEINQGKLFAVQIANKKAKNISTRHQRKAFEKVSTDYHPGYSTPLATDQNGKTIYYMRGMKNTDKTGEHIFTKSYLFMFDKEGKVNESTGIAELEDLWDYQKQLEDFKKLNDWSFSFQ